MRISDIAEHVWSRSHKFTFGLTPSWDPNLFTMPWAKARTPSIRWSSYGPGWYWFSLKMNYTELHGISRPATLPECGCNIGAVSRSNRNVFGEELLCRPNDEGLVVVYNGHEKSVSARVRAHFALQNNRTGALGLNHFTLSHQRWEVRVFSTPCLAGLNDDEKSRVQSLMNSKSGRCAVETAWRAIYGWPVLCKE
jgi:hypothetical protein